MDAGKMIGLVGVLGVGGFVVYEFTTYNNALAAINRLDPTGNSALQIQSVFPFTSWLMAAFGAPAAGTPQGNAYQVLQTALTGQLSVSAQTQTPGTTSAGPSTTSVSTAPTSTTNAAPPTPAATPLPTAQDLQNALNTGTASADQWNYAFRQLTGYGIEQLYGGNFDAIYGPIGANGTRSSGTMTATAFLNAPKAAGLSGLGSGFGRIGNIATFYTPVINPMANMVYRAQHPSPYRLPVGGGMSGLTQATGFEKALWAGGWVRSRRVQG